MIQRKSSLRAFMLPVLAGLALVQPFAHAASPDFPSKPFTFVVPFPPGSGTDTSARYFGEKLTQLTGQPVVVENRPGGNGFIAVKNVLSAPADGYTVFVGSNSTLAMNSAMFKDLPYDPQKDFSPLSMMMRAPTVLVVPPDSPHHSLQELIAAAQASPGQMNYAAGSAGYQLMAELFNDMAGVDIENVPYKGASEAVVAVASGTVDMAMSDITAAYELVKGGKLRALAVADESRAQALPDTPTSAEAGLPGFRAYVWVGAMVPAKTPAAETARLADLFARIEQMPETRDFYGRIGAGVMQGGAEEMRAFQAAEIEQWKRVVAKANIPLQ